MTQISAPSMDISAITKPILDAIDLLLKNAFEASDAPTLTDSQRHEIFQAIRSMLPAGDVVPQIAPVRAAWENLFRYQIQCKKPAELLRISQSKSLNLLLQQRGGLNPLKRL